MSFTWIYDIFDTHYITSIKRRQELAVKARTWSQVKSLHRDNSQLVVVTGLIRPITQERPMRHGPDPDWCSAFFNICIKIRNPHYTHLKIHTSTPHFTIGHALVSVALKVTPCTIYVNLVFLGRLRSVSFGSGRPIMSWLGCVLQW